MFSTTLDIVYSLNNGTYFELETKCKGQIRVGRCTYSGSKRIDPSFDNFESIVVLMQSHSEWGVLGPYVLKDEMGRIMENIWQFSKVYKKTRESKQTYSRWDKTVIWNYPSTTHLSRDNYFDLFCELKDLELVKSFGKIPLLMEKGLRTPILINNETYYTTYDYWVWSSLGMSNKYHVRYPNTFHGKSEVVCSLFYDNIKEEYQVLDYIQARKKIYAPIYCSLVKKQLKFKELQEKLSRGENLLIIEVDGPHDDNKYYKEKYGINNFVQNGTIKVNKNNIKILLNDSKYCFGHGYCLACALLDKDEWLYT
jgi:hypothetical protein